MTSRRSCAAWGAGSPTPGDVAVDVLVPTADRPAELTATLAGLAAQDDPPFAVRVSDQSLHTPAAEVPAVAAMIRVLEAQGRPVVMERHLPRRGVAEQRDFLLGRATAAAVLFLDDDVWLEPGALARLHDALTTLGCGFVGMAVQGLSYLGDARPEEQTAFEPWGDGVQPEIVRPATAAFERWRLHNAANLVHLAGRVTIPADPGWIAYKVAWIGGCVLFDRRCLVEAGGFSFWESLPAEHAGEDVLAQWRVMERHGGAGILPSGAVHLEAPTTLPHREVQAIDLLDQPG